MAIANCKRCGRIFNRVRRDICANCIADEDRIFVLVRDFLKQNHDATMTEVVEGTGAEMELIIEMIQDGRLILRDNPNLSYGCERCGEPTQSGRYCPRCAAELAAALTAASAEVRQHRKDELPRRKGYYSR